MKDRVIVYEGDCLDVMARLIEEGRQVDSVVTDPPYHLTSVVKRFGKKGSAPAKFGTDGVFSRSSKGFMGKQWDGGDIAFKSETWERVSRLMKPGAHLAAFGGTRTFHRLAVAIEDAGLEIRDTIMWVYGTGFPKSHNQHGDWEGWGTALKPAWEPIILARKPLIGTIAANVLQYGTGALNIDGCRVEMVGGDAARIESMGGFGRAGYRRNGDTPAHMMQGTPIAAAAVAHPAGRWPANLCHDGSDEVLAAFPEVPGQLGATRFDRKEKTNGIYGKMRHDPVQHFPRGDDGSAARFFYCAKASKKERLGSKHPTVKPLSLIRYLVRLITPPGGVVLDLFAGSGTTGAAAVEEGFNSVLIERDPEYVADIRRRLDSLHG